MHFSQVTGMAASPTASPTIPQQINSNKQDLSVEGKRRRHPPSSASNSRHFLLLQILKSR
jgi:hypothetical protein